MPGLGRRSLGNKHWLHRRPAALRCAGRSHQILLRRDDGSDGLRYATLSNYDTLRLFMGTNYVTDYDTLCSLTLRQNIT